MVKSNSLRATKSTAGAPCRLSLGCTATLAPTRPIFRRGLASFSSWATSASLANEGVEVWITTRSDFLATSITGSMPRRAGGASISTLPSTSAAGWASQVGNQNDLISRLAW